MSDFSIGLGKKLGAYSLVLGAAYAAVGIMLLLGGEAIAFGDLPRVGVLLVIAAVYLMGAGGLTQGRNEGIAFLMAGLLISIAVGGLYLLETGAHYVMYALGEAEGFRIVESIDPATSLLILALPLLYPVRRLTRGMVW